MCSSACHVCSGGYVPYVTMYVFLGKCLVLLPLVMRDGRLSAIALSAGSQPRSSKLQNPKLKKAFDPSQAAGLTGVGTITNRIPLGSLHNYTSIITPETLF